MVGSVCWRFYVWLLALLASITGNRHRCLPSLGYSDLSALVEGQVISSWNKQEAIKYPEAVWILAMHMGVSRYGQIILCFCITLWTRQTVAVRGQYTTHCVCVHCPILNHPPRKQACEHFCSKVTSQPKRVMFALCCLCSPFEKCAPWGKLSSWLCSASQEYIALASLQRQKKKEKAMSWQI